MFGAAGLHGPAEPREISCVGSPARSRWRQMGSNRTVASLTRQAFTMLSLALMVVSIWNASACAFICANDQAAAAPGPIGCHEGHRAEHRATGTRDQTCPREICARIQPASQTSRPSEAAAPQQAAQFVFFLEIPSGIRSDLTRYRGCTSLLHHGLGPPVPPTHFTVLRT